MLTNATIYCCGKRCNIFIMPLYNEARICCMVCSKDMTISLPDHIPPRQHMIYIEKKYHQLLLKEKYYEKSSIHK
jgi:hypothetical protein